jgi:hypothetical protein
VPLPAEPHAAAADRAAAHGLSALDVPNGTELGYCHDQDEKRGSCFFADHGVAVKTFTKTTTGGTVLRTPGQALFER